jgi:hypothetical protein
MSFHQFAVSMIERSRARPLSVNRKTIEGSGQKKRSDFESGQAALRSSSPALDVLSA